MAKVFSATTLRAFEDACASIPIRPLDRAFDRAGLRPSGDPGEGGGARRTQFRRYVAAIDQRDPQQLRRLGVALGALVAETAESKHDYLVRAAERDGFRFTDGAFVAPKPSGRARTSAAIPIGAKGSFDAVVRREDLASTFKDASLPPVLSTPVMIKFMENAALRAIRPYLAAGETAVGTEVNVRHLAATPVGRAVRAEAEVTAVDGTHISFSVRATDFVHEIGEGSHERRIVDRARMARQIAEAEASDDA